MWRTWLWPLVIVGVLFLWVACQTPRPPTAATFQADKLRAIGLAITNAMAEGKLPGGVFWMERNGRAYHLALGQKSLVPKIQPATEDTLYDAASLTKVLATTPAVMWLIERGRVQLDAPVQRYLPEFSGPGKETVTIRHLLTHTSGLRPGISLTPAWTGSVHALRLACAEQPQPPPGTVFRYSDINFILLGELVQRVTGRKLNEFVAREIYEPLKMKDTGYLPPASRRPRIAPTEKSGDTLLWGVVHDPTARAMGGVAGHAGLFITAADLARFARMMLNEGSLDGVRVFKPETVRLMTTVQSPPSVTQRRGLGWDIDSGYHRPRGQHFPIGSFGHTGWTGTSLWVDPYSRTFWILLSNRVHPDGRGNVLDLQGTLGTLVAEAIPGFNFAYVPGALPPQPDPESGSAPAARPKSARARTVMNGIDVLVRQRYAPLKGLRIGLITNQTGTDRQRRSTIDLLRQAPGVQLQALFSPEHGIRGDRDEKLGDTVDEKTGLPVFSLYGEHRSPRPEQLQGLDALVFDIQDVGCRFYTFISTLGLCLEAAGKARIKFFVLDRVNPINGTTIEGPVYSGASTFTAFHALPVRHAMTVGELARMFNQERRLNADLTVIPVEGWSREAWFDETGLPWTNPSPNLRSAAEAILYPGVGLLETTALSVGRGTGTPFEVIGAPYIDDVRLAGELSLAGLPHVRFVPVRFTPNASVFKGQNCGGVSIVLTDRDRGPVVDIGMVVAQTLYRLYPQQFQLDKFNGLLGDSTTLEAVRAGKSLAEIKKSWVAGQQAFQKRRAACLIYR